MRINKRRPATPHGTPEGARKNEGAIKTRIESGQNFGQKNVRKLE